MSGQIEEILINNVYTRHVYSNYDTNKSITEPKITKSMVDTSTFLSKFMQRFDRQTELLPNNCKFTKSLGNGYKIYLIEDEPKVRTISFRGDVSSILERHKQNGKYEEFGLDKVKFTDPQRFTISLPYVLYVITLGYNNSYAGMRLFFRLNPLTCFNDYLLEPCLSNINDDYQVCLGFSNKYQETGNSNLIIRQIIDEFWFNRFNYDYNNHCKNYEDVPELCDLWTWQHYTQIDPLFIFSTKWKQPKKYRNIGDVVIIDIKDYQDSKNAESVFFSLIKEIQTDNVSEKTYETRYMECDSVLLEDNSIISVGDEITINDKKHYVCSFVHNRYGEITAIKLEDSDKKLIDVKVTTNKNDNYKKLLNAVNTSEIKSFNIDKDTEIKEGELIYFNNSKDIRIIEKIVKTRDGVYQIKIGRDFYLPSSFLKKNIQKMDKNFKFFDIDLIPNNVYSLIDEKSCDSIFRKYEVATFLRYCPKNSKLCFTFKRKNGSELDVMYEGTNTDFKPIENNNISSRIIYRVHDELFTNNDKKSNTIYLLNGKGLGVSNYTDYVSVSERKIICNYDYDISKDFFSKICNEKRTSVVIESFDHNISYSVGEEVIIINWEHPNEMFNIKKITGFSMDDVFFNLVLLDDLGIISQYPIVNIKKGRNEFGSVRKVVRNINDYKVGMRLKAIKSGITDFPGKDCNEIKAFIIDEKSAPLVLFSNYRTLWFSSLSPQNFKIIDHSTKIGSKIILSEPNLKIKMQDGDLFTAGTTKLCIVYSKYYKRRYFYNLSLSSYDGLRTISYSKISDPKRRYGLLLPRYTDSELDAANFQVGLPTIFADVTSTSSYNVKIGIRRRYSQTNEEIAAEKISKIAKEVVENVEPEEDMPDDIREEF